MRRKIRLKEAEPCTDRMVAVPDGYVSDDSLSEGPFRARTDADGFLLTGNLAMGGERPIVFLGDSFVESMLIPEDERFVSAVERELYGYRCLNGGYSGATSLHLFNILVNKVYPIVGSGGTVVFFVGQSDASSIGLPEAYWNGKSGSTSIQPPAPPHAANLVSGASSIIALLNMVVDVCARLDMHLVFGVGAFRVSPFSSDDVLREIYKNSSKRYQQARSLRDCVVESARHVASVRGIALIDAHEVMGGKASFFYDELHLNQRGQEYLASVVVRELVSILGMRREFTEGTLDTGVVAPAVTGRA